MDFQSILVVRYEDLAVRPYQMARKVYKFLGVEYPQEVDEYLGNHTSKSKRVAMGWRGTAHGKNWKVVNEVQTTCGNMMNSFGYRKMDGPEHLGKLNFTSVEKAGCMQCEW